MTATALQNKLNAKVAKLSISMLKQTVIAMQSDDREGSETLMSAALNELMKRLPDADFIAFCEAL